MVKEKHSILLLVGAVLIGGLLGWITNDAVSSKDCGSYKVNPQMEQRMNRLKQRKAPDKQEWLQRTPDRQELMRERRSRGTKERPTKG